MHKVERFSCKEGFIEKLTCDAAFDPSNQSARYRKSGLSSHYYKLDGKGSWINSASFGRMMSFLEFKDEFTSEHIWKKAKEDVYNN